MATRYNINDFALANPAYVGGTVSFYTVSGGVKTATLATLYAASTGSTTLANPRTLDSDGKFSVPVYVEVPTIATVSGLTVADHDTGIMGLAESAAATSAAAADASADAAAISETNAAASAVAAAAYADLGQVVMYATAPSTWVLLDENRVPINISASTTDGLQEAIDYATTNGLNILVIGGGTSRSADYGIINCTTGVVFPALRDMRVALEGVHVAFSAAVTGTGIAFDSCMQLDFSLIGEVTYQGTGAAVQIKPTNAIPVDTKTVVTGSRFYVGGIATTGGTPTALVNIDVSTGSVIGNEFDIGELVGSGAVGSPALAATGLRITGQTGSTAFYANILDIANIHDCTSTCVQEGTSATNQAQIGGNIYRIGQLEPKGTNAQGWNGFGVSSQVTVGNIASAAGGTMNYGIYVQSGSTKNIFNVGLIVGATVSALNDLGTFNSFKYNGITVTPVEARIAPTLAGTWSNVGAGQPNLTYWKDPLNTVWFEGAVTGGGADLIFTLPAAYRPLNAQLFPVTANNAFGYLLVAANGEVSSTSHSNVSLNGISFRI